MYVGVACVDRPQSVDDANFHTIEKPAYRDSSMYAMRQLLYIQYSEVKCIKRKDWRREKEKFIDKINGENII